MTQPDTTTTFAWPTVIERDRWGRPLVYPSPGAKKKTAYTRCTTFVDAIEDKFNLSLWSQRMVAIGLASRPDYLLAVSTADGNRDKLNTLCAQAKEFAQASSAATIGTALHALTEKLDRGEELPPLNPPYAADIAAYREATAPLKMIHREAFTVLDTLKTGGTPDCIFEYQGKRYIGDVKTGSIEWGIGKIARQLAVYARSALYDHETGERTPHGADTSRGLVIHLPAGQGKAELVWVDLRRGWDGVKLCEAVRAHRTLKSGDLARSGLDADPFPDLERLDPNPVDNLLTVINHAEDAHSLRILWRSNPHLFQPHHIEAAKTRIADLDTKIPAAAVAAGVQ